jgi:decaprenyl-phosphate phosphoribosyltransferase
MATASETSRSRGKLRHYIAIARPEHWSKNVFLIPGVVLAEFFVSAPLISFLQPLALTVVSACLVASANYTINEWLDAPYDRHHPTKKNRPAVIGGLRAPLVWLQYAVLGLAGMAIAWMVNIWVFIPAVALFVQGFFYNVEPFRTKDRIILDVVSESVNNPIRLLMGWGAVTSAVFPPSSVLVGYWMFGAFLMDIKRYAELRFIRDRGQAALYRRSFAHYSERKLLLLAVFYALCSGFFFAVFMIKHRIELLVALPFIAGLYTWYLYIGMKDESPARNPESIPKHEPRFIIFLIITSILMIALLTIDIPMLEWFLGPVSDFDPGRIMTF